jgi:hypothetical protein
MPAQTESVDDYPNFSICSDEETLVSSNWNHLPLPLIAFWVTIYWTLRHRDGLLHMVLRHGHLALPPEAPGLYRLLPKKPSL